MGSIQEAYDLLEWFAKEEKKDCSIEVWGAFDKKSLSGPKLYVRGVLSGEEMKKILSTFPRSYFVTGRGEYVAVELVK